MKFTFSWLLDWLEMKLSHDELPGKLTTLGIEVEEVIDYSKLLDKIIVGQILTTAPHPNADKLRVCNVNIGTDKPLQIVCGASNARPSIYVAVSLPGAIIPATNTEIKKGKIRGIESQGMLCSATELNLEGKSNIDGIIELPETAIIGQPIVSALGLADIVYDVSITPNRGDLFSVYGIARQLVAAGYGQFKKLDIPDIEVTIDNPVELQLESENCEYFSTVAIKNFSGSTPVKIAQRLKLCGQKLISPPVDIANYICFDIGQPMHIFDLDKLPNIITIRDTKANEEIKTLAGKIEILPEGTLVAATSEPISIIGIIGGESTAVTKKSSNFLVESSYFNKISIAKTGQALHVNTDARTRFERGVDPAGVSLAQKYFIKMLKEVCPNIQISAVRSVGKLPENKHTLSLSYKKFHDILDCNADDFKKARDVLQNLGFKILQCSDECITVESPSWRHDMSIEEDLIEEFLQINGLDGIHPKPLPIARAIQTDNCNDKLLDTLICNGYQECKTFSIIDAPLAELFAKPLDIVKISEAISSEFAVLRPTVVASHLKAVLNAQNRTLPLIKIAEIGKQFFIKDGKIIEENVLIGTISEIEKPSHWTKPAEISVFDVKSDVLSLINILTTKVRLITGANSYYHPGRSGQFIYQKDTCIAQFGAIHPEISDKIGIKSAVYCFEIFLERLPDEPNVIAPISEVSPYQPVYRDFSFLFDKNIPAGKVIDTIKKLHINEIKDINIFDVYESTGLGNNKKAIAFKLTLQSNIGTLSDLDLQSISTKVVEAITSKCNGVLRDR